MTRNKKISMAGRLAAGITTLFLAVVPLSPGPGAATTELVVADQRLGIALYGFDPLCYFLDGDSCAGSDAFEVKFGGLTWLFRNEGNRAAFLERPDAYVPRFGGYDPVALAREAPVPGHPSMFAVHDGRLFLFYRPENRAQFLANADAVIKAAQTAWPRVRRTLVR